jgi:hypothetical protein
VDIDLGPSDAGHVVLIPGEVVWSEVVWNRLGSPDGAHGGSNM